MTWKRVATAVVLIPLVVSLVLAASTGVVAVALALVILLAIFEYFSLGLATARTAYGPPPALCRWSTCNTLRPWTRNIR